MRPFRVGEKVKITQDMTRFKNNTCSWCEEMKECMGKICTISNVEDECDTPVIQVKENEWNWDNITLEHI